MLFVEFSNLFWQRVFCIVLMPVTGRILQLRVHMLSLGLLEERLYAEPVASDRLKLYVWKLGFTHPEIRDAFFFEPELTYSY